MRHRLARLRRVSAGAGWGDCADTFNFSRVSRAHYQAQLAVSVPWALRQAGDVFVQQGLAFHAGKALVLQVISAGVGRATECSFPSFQPPPF